jgi:hypothetical protein
MRMLTLTQVEFSKGGNSYLVAGYRQTPAIGRADQCASRRGFYIAGRLMPKRLL